MKRAAFLRFAGACALGSLARVSRAQVPAFPTRQVKLIVPYSAGGLPDTVARILAQRLHEALGQAVVVDNRAGAGGSAAAATLAQAPADGHTLLLTDGPMLSITPLLSSKMTYDAARDFVPVSLVGMAPLFLAVHPSLKARTIGELVALAKAKPGALNYGSSGIGSIHHLTAEAMKTGLGIFVTHIPFRGSANSVPAMIGGQVDMAFSSPPSIMGFVKNGQARLLAINSAQRSPLSPDVPTLAETLPGFDFAFNVVVMARTGTPADAIARISGEIAKIVQQPGIAEQLHQAGVEPVGGTPEQLAIALRKEALRVAAAAKSAGLRAE